jgi:hypothetical protein
MAAIAARAPGFAGMLWDVFGRLIIRTTPDADPGAVVAAIADPDIARHFRGVHDAIVEGRFEVRLDAAFDFRTLMSFRDSLRPALMQGGMNAISIDEARNTVQIGTTSSDAEATIRDAALRLLIPPTVLVFEIDSGLRRQTSLRDSFRPVPAGVQVNTPYSRCTVGPNVITVYGSGFVTASHCTEIPWQTDSVNFFYFDLEPADLVGFDFADPTPSELGRVCDPYDRCRLSDAAFILYDYSLWAELGRIARTEELGSTTIDIWHPRFVIAGEGGWLLTGARVNMIRVNMMGKNSGWTAGEVTETCVDFVGYFDPPLDPPTTVLLCQTKADYESQDGDSGGPVFTWDFSGEEVTLEGIHVAGTGEPGYWYRAWFSPWVSVAFELGAVLPGFTPIP